MEAFPYVDILFGNETVSRTCLYIIYLPTFPKLNA